MIKIGRDFILLFTMSLLYIVFNKAINISMVEGIIVSSGTAGIFSLLSDTIRNIDENNLRTRVSLSEKELKIIAKMRLVARDGILTFILCYGIMRVSFGGPKLTIIDIIPFIIAALAPTLVVCELSKELRKKEKGNVIVDR